MALAGENRRCAIAAGKTPGSHETVAAGPCAALSDIIYQMST